MTDEAIAHGPRAHRGLPSRCPTLVALAVLATLATACGDDAVPAGQGSVPLDERAKDVPPELRALAQESLVPGETFVGRVEGTDAYAAVVEKDGSVTAYFCDGETIGLWFETGLEDGAVSAQHPGGATLAATRDGSGFYGSVTIDGIARSFDTASASYPAGLWEGFGDIDLDAPNPDPATASRYGWIVLPDGSQRGSKVQTTSVSSGGTVEPDTASGSDGTVAVPSTPPPAPTSDPELEACRKLAHQYYNAVGLARLAPEDSSAHDVLVRIAINTFRSYYNSGCKGVWGEL